MKLVYPLRIIRSQRGATKTSQYLRTLYFRYRKGYLEKAYGEAMSPLRNTWEWCWDELVLRSYKLVKRNGRAVQEMTGVPVLKQYLDMLRFALFLPMRPQNYYIFDLFDPKNRAKAKDFIFRHETKNVLYKMLTDTPSLGKVSPVTHKGKFARKVLDAGLSTAPTFCSIDQGSVVYFGELPPADLFVKRLRGKGGVGAEQWRYLPEEGVYQKKRKKKERKVQLDAQQLIRHYQDNSYKDPVVIQRRISNHPEIVDLSANAAATCRVMTILNEDDEPEVVAAVYRMAARKGSIVDNFHRGGIAAPVNIENGVLGLATNLGLKKVGFGRVSHHPLTGAPIEGRRLPYWSETLELAIRAHEVFRPRVVVGWDICITDNGPVLVEGNAQPCVDFIQRTYNQPMGRTRFGELMAFHIHRNFGDS